MFFGLEVYFQIYLYICINVYFLCLSLNTKNYLSSNYQEKSFYFSTLSLSFLLYKNSKQCFGVEIVQ